MFGYVRPIRGSLPDEAFSRYQAAYCGLCTRLGRRLGYRARFTVNYDLTFLSLLLGAAAPEHVCRECPCPARPGRKKRCRIGGEEQDFCADLCVILYEHKLRDAIEDEPFFRALGARLASRLLRRAYKKAAASCPDEDALVRGKLAALRALEKSGSDSLDRTADAFASILRAGAARGGDEKTRRVLEQLLYHVGRYIYLVDALDDLPRDCKTGAYNVLARRFSVQDGKLADDDRAALLSTINASIGLACAAFELLPGTQDRDILDHILYSGLPAAALSVAAGTFHPEKKHRSTT